MKKYVAKVTLEKNIKTKVAFSSGVAPFLLKTNEPGNIPVVIDFCDSDAEKWRAYSEQVTGPSQWIYAREAKRLAICESQFIDQASASFAITTKEAQIFNNRGVANSVVDYWENGVDTHYFNPETEFKRETDNRADIVFVGAMDYLPNVEGVEWFCEKVWPKLLERNSGLTFAIVGSKPTQRVQKLSKISGVQVTGRVDDVRPWLAQSQMVVAPLLVARGIQNKVLEAMAMARPVIASQEAATGIKAIEGDEILINNTPDEMISQILALLQASEQGKKIGLAARARVLSDYSWRAKLQRLDDCLNQYR